MLTADEVLDAVFQRFCGRPNAADLGEREVQIREPFGIVGCLITTVFVPVSRGDEGVIVSRGRLKEAPRPGQADGGLAYTNIDGLDAAVRRPGGVERMFACHLSPTGPRAGLVKSQGQLFHLTPEGKRLPVTAYVACEPELRLEATGSAIVIDSDLKLDDRYAKIHVVREAGYAEDSVAHVFDLVVEDMNALPTHNL